MTTNINKFAYGCLPRIVGIRRALVEGKRYRIARPVIESTGVVMKWMWLTLEKKYRNFARFRVDGVSGSYCVCYGYHELMQELDRQAMKEEVL